MKRTGKQMAMKRVVRRVKKHWLMLSCIGVGVLVSVGTLVTYTQLISQQVARDEMAIKQDTHDADMLNAQAKVARAEAAAKQRVLAEHSAEQAKSGEVAADTRDSKACNGEHSHADPSAIDVVVNKKHCIQPLTYEPSHLVTTHGATLNYQVVEPFNRFFSAAAAAGQPFYVTSSYRSYQKQVSTYNHWITISGQAGADTYSARAGYSEHQTGYAFDVAANGCTLDCFGSTSQYIWLQEHAAEYGFIQRYYSGYDAVTGYKAEEWHYRYVGTEVAKDMKAKGVKTLESYWNISGGDY